ncbi:Sodium/sulfate symporter [Punctularia strigosozonata HHB-11173 SS5]|uniref:Sodium/sulfate symporter n=1 Tax=Punctularia strigosozonata (strain HHB-11173) TaxID=741275 RepID=R7S0L1_PUNST|nr:Sodium/sulfate symporter [Punctularia strigosozonata HHB-11173 SS5]EIN03935.1 Sodium/sulfate symporter [Punctularia strigosozonata HHB-11173 SS5]
MKFSSSLKFNAVPEWWDDYIAYDALKKHVYELEKRQVGLQPYRDVDLEAGEQAPLVANGSSSTDDEFKPLLDREITKISAFYERKERELLAEAAELEELVEKEDELGPLNQNRYTDDLDDDDDDEDDDETDSRAGTRSPEARRRRLSLSQSGHLDDSLASLPPMSAAQERASHRAASASFSPTRSPAPRRKRPDRSWASRLKDSIVSIGSAEHGPDSVGDTTWTSSSNYAWDTRLLFRRRITNLYVSVSSLKSYVEINYSGFRKILKKYDKVTDSQLKDRYLHDVVDESRPFTQSSRDTLDHTLADLQNLYAKCVCRGDAEAARRELRLHQREHIAWERDTVWRTMINQARRGGDDGVGHPTIVADEKPSAVVSVGKLQVSKKMIAAAISVLVGLVLLNVQVVEGVAANRCLAILVFSTIMWATEAIPLFVTSMLVPLLLITLRVIRDPEDESRLSPPAATKYVFSVMFSPTIMLLIGGFTIASALSKTSIDRLLITRVLSLAGSRPSTVLLAFMGVSCFASMWISNVAAPTLCFTLIKPILRTLPGKTAFAPCLIMGIALAANIGGQSSPISSPQNLIAIGEMDPQLDWGKWFTVAIPVSVVSILLIWLLLLASYRPARHPDGESELEIKPVRAARESFTLQQWWVTFVCLATIGLWCVEHSIESWVGDMGVIALLPVVAFFGTGVLKKDDFEQFAWTIVFLAMGGIALGKGVTSSGLLEVLDELIRDLVEGLSLYTVVLVLSPVVLVISTFISHTIASVLLVPIAKEVGNNLPGNHANLLIFITGLICSTGMGMPVSGFPNQTAANQEDELGQLYLSNMDFLKNGVPASIIATLVVSTIGYLLMRLIGL